MKRRTCVDYWPEHLRAVFVAIGSAMAGKRLHPDTLEQVDLRNAIADHHVAVLHRSAKTAGVTSNHYVIEIDGPRIIGRWPFRSGELETLARAAIVNRAPPLR